jgi:hypothetical protein
MVYTRGVLGPQRQPAHWLQLRQANLRLAGQPAGGRSGLPVQPAFAPALEPGAALSRPFHPGEPPLCLLLLNLASSWLAGWPAAPRAVMSHMHVPQPGIRCCPGHTWWSGQPRLVRPPSLLP